jgi:hypothetical protein
MQLDKTRIVICERGFLDLLDLSLGVIRTHALGLCAAWLVGVVPFALLNAWLVAPLLQIDESHEVSWSYLWHLAVLTIWELPLATSIVTIYLSRALFQQRPAPSQLFKQFASRLPQLFFVQVFLRGMLAVWDVVAMEFGAPGAVIGLLGFFIVSTWTFAHMLWPYLNEVLLLEGNPLLRNAASSAASTGTIARTISMHAQGAGDVILRWFGSILIGTMLLAAVTFSLDWLVEQLTFTSDQNITLLILFPAAIWLVAGFFAVVRYLSYLDLRIRNEGWEIELLLRAEGDRIARQLS